MRVKVIGNVSSFNSVKFNIYKRKKKIKRERERERENGLFIKRVAHRNGST